MLSGAQNHVNCFDQCFICFCEIFILRLTTVLFTKFKARFDGWYFTSLYIHFFKYLA